MVQTPALSLARRAEGLQQALPALLVEAERVAATLLLGTHGRKRTGTGETFWQYRPYSFGDSTQRIDWRRSARGAQVMIRENEWEAANTLLVWVQPSERMRFVSKLSTISKGERAMLLALALSSLALRAHERVNVLGTAEAPVQSRTGLATIAQRLLRNDTTGPVLPLATRAGRHAAAVLLGDFLDPLHEIKASLTAIAAQGISGHIVQVNDPAEESLPYQGRVKFFGLGDDFNFTAEDTSSLRSAYKQRFQAQREGLKEIAKSLGWSFLSHHTDLPASPPLLSLHTRVGQR